jgi:ABC-type lipoprotein release transport system permease subunit
MKFLFVLALRNIWRYRRRTLLTASVIAIGLMMYLLVDSLLVGIDKESVRNLKRYETGSLQIMHSDYWEDRTLMPLDKAIPSVEKLLGLLQKEGYTATIRTQFAADMILYQQDFGEDGNLPVQVTAVDLSTYGEVFDLENTLIAGRFPELGSHEMVIGSWLAEDLNAEIGYVVTLITRGNGGFYEAMDMEISGIVRTPNPAVNRNLLLVPIDTISDYLALEHMATEITIALSNADQVEQEKQSLQKLVAQWEVPLTVRSWDEVAYDHVAMIEMEKSSSSMILFLIFLIAAVGISNTMIMAINERIRELGMMRSMGMKDMQIQLLFILESGAIGLIGSVLGIIFGSVVNYFLVTYGIDFGFLMREMDLGYRIQNIFYGAWHLKGIIITGIMGIILSVAAAFFPARRATMQDIPTCLRHQ